MAGTVFISYRRDEDAAVAGRLYDWLKHAFHQRLFMDVDNILPGEDFVAVLEAQVAACEVLLAVIGRGWLTATDKNGNRRLDNPDDFVRIEIASALAQGKRVIPVLIGDAKMPEASELPNELMPLTRLHGVWLTHDRFRGDVERLVRKLEEATAQAKGQVEEEERRRAEQDAQRQAEEAKRRAETPEEGAEVAKYRKAADQGNAFGQNNLGAMYENGRGVPQDDAEAVKWYRKAADQGNAFGQNNLGAMYENGRGVPQDDAEAVKWYRKAADQGNAKAQEDLSRLSGKKFP